MTPKTLAQLLAPTLVVGLVWGAVAWFPSVRSMDESDDRLLAAESDRVVLLQSLAEVRALPDLDQAISQRLQQVAIAVPAENELGFFIRSLDEAAAENHVTVANLAPVQVDDNQSAEASTQMPIGISSISFGLTANGGYEDLLGFLRSIEDLDRLVILDSIDVFADAEDIDTLVVDLELRVFTSGAITQFGATDQGPDGTLAFDNEIPSEGAEATG